MRIESGAIAMQSDREYHALQEKSTVSVQTSDSNTAVILTYSHEVSELTEKNSQNVFGSKITMLPNQKKQKTDTETKTERDNGKNADNKQNALEGLVGAMQTKAVSQQPQAIDENEMKLQILKTLISAMRRLQMFNAKKGRYFDSSQLDMLENQYEQTKQQSKMFAQANKFSITGGVGLAAGANSSGNSTVWHKTTMESVFVSETENTAYSAQGIVKTADGRTIGFNVDVEMSREFCAEYESLTSETYIVTDPLVINLDTDIVNVTDQKFLFDIDSDGDKEELSFVGEGSGFLAIDKNNDGTINDGGELFGTKSGDGFRDLAQYDEDRNGWIDEADSVFNDLKIWTKDSNGEDSLIDLKQAGVGALYLGSASTEFSLNDTETNKTNAVVRKTGIYLKESGEAGTLNHVDLVL